MRISQDFSPGLWKLHLPKEPKQEATFRWLSLVEARGIEPLSKESSSRLLRV